MAIYHFRAQVIQRSAGRSSVGAAAYRAGERIRDERTGITHSYERKKDVAHAEIVVPEGAPEWASDRSKLWNGIEQAEKRKDSQTAREFELALPRELSLDEQKKLVRGWVVDEFTARGIVADFAIHKGHSVGENENPHTHVLVATRAFGAGGKFGPKVRDDNSTEKLMTWRESWERSANRALERAGREERIDRRSLAGQGIDREPTVHLGQTVTALERRGIATERGEINRSVRALQQAREAALDLGKTLANAWKALEERAVTEVRARLSSPWNQEAKAQLRFTDPATLTGPQTGIARHVVRDAEHGISVLALKNDDRTAWKPYEFQGVRIDERSAEIAKNGLSILDARKREIVIMPGALVQVERDPQSLAREHSRDRGRSIADEKPMSRGGDPFDWGRGGRGR